MSYRIDHASDFMTITMMPNSNQGLINTEINVEPNHTDIASIMHMLKYLRDIAFITQTVNGNASDLSFIEHAISNNNGAMTINLFKESWLDIGKVRMLPLSDAIDVFRALMPLSGETPKRSRLSHEKFNQRIKITGNWRN